MNDPLYAEVSSAAIADGGAVRWGSSGVIRVRGADAASFLHGQLTNDFAALGTNESRLAAFCSAKGRMLASFVGFRRSEDELWLVCRADLLEATLKRLRMFVLRAKAQLDAPGSTECSVVGLAGPCAQRWLASKASEAATMPLGAHTLLPGGASLVRLPDAAGMARWLWAGDGASAQVLLDATPALAPDLWDWLEVRAGIAPVQAATADAFVPQMLNYELVGGVSFQKGCYPGQEVVARSQYRGTLKRRTQRVQGTEPMEAGDDVYWSGDPLQPSGRVALAAPSPAGGFEALVELKLAALAIGSLHLGAIDGPALRVCELPYALPTAPREPASA